MGPKSALPLLPFSYRKGNSQGSLGPRVLVETTGYLLGMRCKPPGSFRRLHLSPDTYLW